MLLTDTMEKAVFIMEPVPGHLNPTFSLARALSKQGVEVVYAVPANMFSAVRSQHFKAIKFLGFSWIGEIEEFFNRKKRFPYLETLLDKITHYHYRIRKRDFDRMLAAIKPRYIFLDSFLSADIIFIHDYILEGNCEVVLLQTMMPPNDDGLAPPPNSRISAPEKNTLLVRLAWLVLYASVFKRRAVRFVKYAGYDFHSMLAAKLKRGGMQALYQTDRKKAFHIGFKSFTELILAPGAFDFPHRNLGPEKFYLGSMINTARTDSNVDDAYPAWASEFKNRRSSSKRFTVYCSLGTILYLHADYGQVESFYRRLILACSDQPIDLIINMDLVLRNKIHCDNQNVFIFTRVPQLEVLAMSDLFVCHGGLNSILESITLQVPMLVFPLNNRWDQRGNAARVVYHGLGMTGELDDAANAIQKKMKLLCTDVTYRHNLSEFKNRMDVFSEERVIVAPHGRPSFTVR